MTTRTTKRTLGGTLLLGTAFIAWRALAATAAPPPPRPAPELDALGKLEGRWSCTGEAPAGPMGPGRRYQSTFHYTRGLGGFFWLSEYDQALGKENPMALAGRGFLRWDGQRFAFASFLSTGATAAESVSFDGTTYVGIGELRGGPQPVPLRETLKLDGDRQMTWTGEVKLGRDYTVIGRDTCHRSIGAPIGQ
jgi:hypothetical protein